MATNNPRSPIHSSDYLLVTKTREERRQWMTKLQELNPKLLPHDTAHISPDTPLPPRKIRSDSINPNSEAVSMAQQLARQHLDEGEGEELAIHDGDSDHEFHEPDEEQEGEVQGDEDCVTISIPVVSLKT